MLGLLFKEDLVLPDGDDASRCDALTPDHLFSMRLHRRSAHCLNREVEQCFHTETMMFWEKDCVISLKRKQFPRFVPFLIFFSSTRWQKQIEDLFLFSFSLFPFFFFPLNLFHFLVGHRGAGSNEGGRFRWLFFFFFSFLPHTCPWHPCTKIERKHNCLLSTLVKTPVLFFRSELKGEREWAPAAKRAKKTKTKTKKNGHHVNLLTLVLLITFFPSSSSSSSSSPSLPRSSSPLLGILEKKRKKERKKKEKEKKEEKRKIKKK